MIGFLAESESLAVKCCHFELAVFEAKFLGRLCSYLKTYRQIKPSFIIWFTRKMLDLLILKLMFSLLDCMRNLPSIIYKKPPI